MAEKQPEFWLRGPVEGVPDPLQPVAHALLQTLEEVRGVLPEISQEILWARPGGVAAAGFHLRHIAGVVDRLFTYARGEQLDEHQLLALRAESQVPEPPVSATELFAALELQIEGAVETLRRTDPDTLSDPRPVGRKALPSNVRGLLFHAAEHSQRHLGQLLVTVRVQNGSNAAG